MSIRRPKTRRLVFLLVLVLAPPLMVLAWLWFGPADRSGRPDFDSIRRGMTLGEVRAVLDPSAELKCLMPGPGAEQYLVVWKGEGAGGMIYLRGGAVQFKDFVGRQASFRDQFRRWWFQNIGIGSSLLF